MLSFSFIVGFPKGILDNESRKHSEGFAKSHFVPEAVQTKIGGRFDRLQSSFSKRRSFPIIGTYGG